MKAALRWLVPDRRDGVVTLAAALGLGLYATTGILADEVEPRQVARLLLLHLREACLWALFVLVAARWSAQWRVAGWRRHVAVAVLMGTVLGAKAALHVSLGAPSEFTARFGVSPSDPAIAYSVALLWFPVALLLAAQLHRTELERHATARLHTLLRDQRETQRRFAEARLKVIQSRIGPELLFDMLDHVRRLYGTNAARAEDVLDALTAYLRKVLPNLRQASSTLGQEQDVAKAYVHMRSLAEDSVPAFESSLPASLVDAPFPPGVLLPLVDAILAVPHRANGPIVFGARREGNALLASLAAPVTPSPAAVHKAHEALRDLFGDEAALSLQGSTGEGFTVLMTLRHGS